MNYNKVCSLEDFSDPDLAGVIREVFWHEQERMPPEWPAGVADSKQWEIAMSCRALRDLGALHRESVILGVGAGTEVTPFYLSKLVRQVFATDLYLSPGVWGDVAPAAMLVEPERFAPYDFERERLAVQHMDGRCLRFPDNSFDGIFSSGSIEHFGSLQFIANAAHEMGRVLKPGGVLTLATEFKIAGPPGGDGWEQSTFVLSEDRIAKYIVEASGLEPVDPLETRVSDATMSVKRDLSTFLASHLNGDDFRSRAARYPNLVLVHEGYVFASVHLTLKKTDNYPASGNEWARPSGETREAVAAGAAEAGELRLAPADFALTTRDRAEVRNRLEAALQTWDAYFRGVLMSRMARRLPGPLATLYRAYLRIRYLGRVWHAQDTFYRELVAAVDDLDVAVGAGDRAAHRATSAAKPERSEEFSVHAAEMRRELEDLRREVHDAAQAVADLSSRTRLLEHGVVAGDGDLTSFSGGDLIRLVQSLESTDDSLRRAGAIDVSIQEAAAEPQLIEVSEYFGARLSARTPVYRMPNDAWYHIDLGGTSITEQLFRNAARKLGPDGVFVLVSSGHFEPRWDEGELELVSEAAESLGETPVHVSVFRTRRDVG